MNDLKPLYPTFIWVIFEFVCLITLLLATNESVGLFATLMLIIGGLAIIPIFYFVIKYKKDVKMRKRGYEKKEVIFNVINGEIYVDNQKMKVSQNKFRREIYVTDLTTENFKDKATAHMTIYIPVVTFYGIIEEPYVNDFERF